MIRLVAILTTLLVLLAGAPAWAAQNTGEKVLDTIKGLLNNGQSLTGHVVVMHDNELVLRGQEGKTYVIATAGVDAQSLAQLQPGQDVSVKLRPGQDQTLIADSVQVENGTPQSFQTATGTVQSVNGSRLSFRTSGGMTVPVDLSQIAGRVPQFRSNQPATLYYEPQSQSSIVAVWVEPRSTGVSSTTGQTPSASPPTTAMPGTATGAYQRIHGYVQSIGVGTLSLKSDDGRTVTVDTSHVGGQTHQGMQPGDLVSVVGKETGTNQFTADLIEKDR